MKALIKLFPMVPYDANVGVTVLKGLNGNPDIHELSNNCGAYYKYMLLIILWHPKAIVWYSPSLKCSAILL